jgi:hypothetical protein
MADPAHDALFLLAAERGHVQLVVSVQEQIETAAIRRIGMKDVLAVS